MNTNIEIEEKINKKMEKIESLMPQIKEQQFLQKLNPSHTLVGMGIFPLGPFGDIVADLPTCFARGTEISMADGSTKNVETLVPATPDEPTISDVILSVDGVKTHVIGMLAGPRPEPLIQITAKTTAPEYPEKVLKVMVSMGHTISVDLSRMVHTWFLRRGDYVCSTYGQAIIEKIETVDYKDEVFNIFLASSYFVKRVLPDLTPERLYYHLANSSLGLTPKQHLIFGNNILSGDLYVQIYSAELAHLGYNLSSYI